jgi:hypothetical protein
MGKKLQQHCWPEPIRLRRLNRNDVERSRELGFRPGSLLRARPGAKNKWKLPVNQWVRARYRARFGYVLVSKQLPAPVSLDVEPGQEAIDQFEEELFWEDDWARNEDQTWLAKRKDSQAKPAKAPDSGLAAPQQQGLDDDPIPF